jgi:DNA-binding NarL/FixJ family response regulator
MEVLVVDDHPLVQQIMSEQGAIAYLPKSLSPECMVEGLKALRTN